jgi:hypothetical protein
MPPVTNEGWSEQSNAAASAVSAGSACIAAYSSMLISRPRRAAWAPAMFGSASTRPEVSSASPSMATTPVSLAWRSASLRP